MGAAYTLGLRTALRRWPVALLLFVVSFVAAASFTTAAWCWLSAALGASLATRTLLTNLDMNVFIDLFVHHQASLRMLLVTGTLLAVVFVALGVWLSAVAVVAVGKEGGLREYLKRGLGLYPTYAQLWVLANLLNLVCLGGVALLGYQVSRWTAESPSETTFYWLLAASLVLGGLLLLFSTTVHDHARIHTVATGVGAARAYWWALAYVGRREARALPLAALLLASGIACWAVYQFLGMHLRTTSGTGVTVSILWGEALLLIRMFLRLWFFAAETELQSIHE